MRRAGVVYVYALIARRGARPFYVGITRDPAARLRQHATAGAWQNLALHARICRAGSRLRMWILAAVSEADWQWYERRVIEQGAAMGWRLVNLTSGGLGYSARLVLAAQAREGGAR